MDEGLIKIKVDKVELTGNLLIPEGAEGVVLFAHGSGSSRHSPRNQFVAELLREGELATLLIDLLTKDEEKVDERSGELRFDIDMLTKRLVGLTNWLSKYSATKRMKIGLFGASTGAAAALATAAVLPAKVAAVVSRGGRPDLAGNALSKVQAPTLLIVGGDDTIVIDLNQKAFDLLQTTKELVIIPGATHLFEEPGALEEVGRLAEKWFQKHLTSSH